MIARKLILLFLFLICSSFIGAKSYSNPQNLPVIERVIVLSGRENHPPGNTNLIVKFNEEIRLYALLKCREGYYLGYENSSFPGEVRVNGESYSVKNGSLKRWNRASWGSLNIRWYKIMPRMAPSNPRGEYRWYSNVFSKQEGEEGKWRGWQIIEYKQIPLKEQGWSIKLARDAGTFRFRAEVVFNGKVISSPGRPDPDQPSGISARDYYRGIKDTVRRISRLSNHPNKLIRYIEALRGVPWLWGPDYTDPPQNTPSLHQSDFHNPVGIECSSILISSLRAMGNKDLKYTTTKNLALGKYTRPITDTTLTYSKRSFFGDWIPRGISRSSQGNFYVYGAHKIQIRDERFALIEEIKNTSYQFIDVAPSEGEKIYCIVEKDLNPRIATIDREGRVRELFTPKVKKTVLIGEEKYLCEVGISPRGMEVASFGADTDKGKRIYLLDSDTVYIFNLQGEELEAIPLEGALTRWTFSGSVSVQNDLLYIPVHENKILVYNLEGRIVRIIDIQQDILDADVKKEKITILHSLPLTVQLYNLDGSFFMDFGDRFLNEKGDEVRIKIGSSSKNLHVGDLMITIFPSYHLLLFYEDNGNNLLDSRDKVICAGHKGIEIRKVSYFEDRKFLLKRLEADIKVQ